MLTIHWWLNWERQKEEFFGKICWKNIPELEKTKLFAELEECMTKQFQDPWKMNSYFQAANTAVFSSSVAQPVPEGLFVLSVDITKRKDGNEDWGKAKKKFRSLCRKYYRYNHRSTPEFKILFVNHLPAGADSSSLRDKVYMDGLIRNMYRLQLPHYKMSWAPEHRWIMKHPEQVLTEKLYGIFIMPVRFH